MPRAALLGDSIFDNGSYTGGGPAVIDHLRGILPAGWSADLLAIDGSITSHIRRQLHSLTDLHTHLVLSVGGNDALHSLDLLSASVHSGEEALGLLATAAAEFSASYAGAIEWCLNLGLPLVICTIYNCNFPKPEYQAAVRMALCAFNDVIIRTAMTRDLRVIELREVCARPEDYAKPIEPSVIGGARIARAIASALFNGQHSGPGARIAA